MKYWLLILTFFSSLGMASVIPNQPHIYVEGDAEVKVRPDIIKITVQLTHIDLSAEIAKKEVDEKSLRLLEKLKALSIKEADIKAEPMRFNEEYDYRDGTKRLRGIHVLRKIEFTLRDINSYYKVNQALAASKISALISARASLADEKSTLRQVKMAALKDAKSKAIEMAALNNKQIKDVYSISEFKTRQDDAFQLSVQPERYEAMQMAKGHFQDSHDGNIFTINDMTFTATIYVVYTLK